MAATAVEPLFSLELLVDWVRMEGGPLQRGASPAVAFRLLDFPPLLVLPPTAPGPAHQSGTIAFRRGKSCLLRLRPAALRRSRLRSALLVLPAEPGAEPRLLGTCDLPLDASLARRGIFALYSPAGQRVGEVALFYRLSDLGCGPKRTASFQTLEISRPQLREDPEPCPQGNSEPRPHGNSEPRPQEISKPGLKQTLKLGTQGFSKLCSNDISKPRSRGAPESPSRDASVWSVGDSNPSAVQKHWEEASPHSKACSGDMGPVSRSPAPRERSVSPLNQEAPELDFETNTICPPPLYYTHLPQEKVRPAQVKITIKPQRNPPDVLDGVFPEINLLHPPSHPVKYTKSATQESPPVHLNPPPTQGPEAANAAASHSQTEQSAVNTIRQLPLLNALLIELSLLYNQPVASPTHVHPQLAWLYRVEPKGPEPSPKSTSCSKSKKTQFSAGEHEKPTSLPSQKNQVENQKGKHLESRPPRVTKGRLLYGLTNTLRLRLKQTNPQMLIEHEKREQYRKMQIQAVGSKFRVPACKLLSLAPQSQMPPQLPKEKPSGSSESFVEESDTSGQISAVFDEPSTTGEVKPSLGIEKPAADWSATRNSSVSLKTVVSPADSIVSERFAYTTILRGKSEVKAQSPCVSREDAAIDRIVGEEVDNRQVKTMSSDIVTADGREARPKRSNSYENISELGYSDDFTSSCYSEDFCTTENSSTGAENPSHSSYASGLNEERLFRRTSSSDKNGVLSPPFSAHSPVCSHKKSHVIKIRDRSLQEAPSVSTSDLSLKSQWTDGKENQTDLMNRCKSKVVSRGQDISIKLQTVTGSKSSKKSQSPRTSQVSPYLPSNLSELELKASGSSTSEEEDDDLGSLSISKQCKDIRELIINKLPGYTV